MIKINNVPCGYQERFDGKTVFILLHELIGSKVYRDFYLNSKQKFDLIILDNSCFELGKSLSNELLIEWACELRKTHPNTPIEIVIPDNYGNKNETLKLMEDFLLIDTSGFTLMGVPQGKDELELIECLEAMEQEDKIDTIGINKLWSRHVLEDAIEGLNKSIHLLGLNSLKEWAYDYGNLNIRSADSRILAKLVTGKDDPWNEKLDEIQLSILYRLIDEVNKW